MRRRPTPTLHVLRALLLAPITLLPLACAAHAAQPASDPVPSPTSAPATPHLDELASIYSAIPERVRWHQSSLLPNVAGLEFFESADPDAHAQLTRELALLQPVIERAIALAAQTLEPFPPQIMPTPDEPNAHLRHPLAHVQNTSRLLLADASRAFDDKDPTAALVRIAATAQFASSLLSESSYNARDSGLSFLTHASRKLSAMVAADPALMRSADRTALQTALDAYAGLDPRDPGSLITSWESEARETLAYCREHFTGAAGPEKYAAYLTESGAYAAPLAALPRLLDNREQEFPAESKTLSDMLPNLLPTKEHASYAAAMTPAQISAALNDAESLIPPIATALRTNDLAALTRALQAVTEDQTQLARIICGGAGLTLELALTTRRAITDAMRALDALKPE